MEEITDCRLKEVEYNAQGVEDERAEFFSVNTLHTRVPFLNACLLECLRLHTSAFSLRVATRDVAFETSSQPTLKVKENELLVMANESPHHDPTVFPSPEIFDPERFLLPTTISQNVRGFGGGTGIVSVELLASACQTDGVMKCKGRALAIYSELYLVIRCLELYDIQVQSMNPDTSRTITSMGGARYSIPKHVAGRVGTGSCMPDGRVVLEIRPRSQ